MLAGCASGVSDTACGTAGQPRGNNPTTTTFGYNQQSASIYAGHDLVIAAGQTSNAYGNLIAGHNMVIGSQRRRCRRRPIWGQTTHFAGGKLTSFDGSRKIVQRGIQLYMDRLQKPDRARLKSMPIPGYEQTGKSTSINRRGGSGAWRGCRDFAALASRRPPAACAPHFGRPSALCIGGDPKRIGCANTRSRQDHLPRPGLLA